MKKLLTAVVCLILVCLVMTGCGRRNAGDDNTIKIGSVHPLTGSMAYEGQALVNAQQIAIDEINENGGIQSLGGKKLKLVTQDTQGDASIASLATQSVIRERVVAVTGTFTSATAMTASQQAEKAKIPFVVTVATATDMMDRGYNYTFRIQPNVEGYCSDYIKYLKEIKPDKLKTAVIMHEDSTYGTSIAEYVEKHIKEAGVKVLDTIAYPASASSLSAEVTRLTKLAPDILVPIGYYADQSIMMKEIVERNVKIPMIAGAANGAFSDAKFIKAFGAAANGIVDVNYSYNPKSEKADYLRQQYLERYGEEIPVHAVYGYESIKVIADALERAGSEECEDLRIALEETDLAEHVLPHGNIKFDDTGENINAAGVMVQIQDEKRVIIYPEEYAESQYQE